MESGGKEIEKGIGKNTKREEERIIIIAAFHQCLLWAGFGLWFYYSHFIPPRPLAPSTPSKPMRLAVLFPFLQIKNLELKEASLQAGQGQS